MNSTKFYVINRRKSQVWDFDNTKSLASFFVAKNVKHFIVVKSDHTGDRVIDLMPANSDAQKIVKISENA